MKLEKFNLIQFNFFLIQTTTCMWQTKDEMKCENVKWKMWWYEEDFECIMNLLRMKNNFKFFQIWARTSCYSCFSTATTSRSSSSSLLSSSVSQSCSVSSVFKYRFHIHFQINWSIERFSLKTPHPRGCVVSEHMAKKVSSREHCSNIALHRQLQGGD